MTKRKLEHFKENLTFQNLLQPKYSEIAKGFYLRGNWNSEFFNNPNPIILELGCGKGEYSINLAEKYPDKNFIGIDIKGARIWKGSRYSNENKMKNIAFIRTKVDLLEFFFGENEISEIWLTFPDPHPKKAKQKNRMSSSVFLGKYKNILVKNHIIHLKTDNTQLFETTLETIEEYNHCLLYENSDIYHSNAPKDVVEIQTFYEKSFLEENKKIHYLSFRLNPTLF